MVRMTSFFVAVGLIDLRFSSFWIREFDGKLSICMQIDQSTPMPHKTCFVFFLLTYLFHIKFVIRQRGHSLNACSFSLLFFSLSLQIKTFNCLLLIKRFESSRRKKANTKLHWTPSVDWTRWIFSSFNSLGHESYTNRWPNCVHRVSHFLYIVPHHVSRWIESVKYYKSNHTHTKINCSTRIRRLIHFNVCPFYSSFLFVVLLCVMKNILLARWYMAKQNSFIWLS